jgi:hypothetical protein
MLFEIGFPQKAAITSHEPVDLVCNLAFIKNVATFFTDQLQRFRESWIFENIAFRGSAALAIERVSFEKGAGQSFIQARPERPVISNQFRDRKSLFGVPNRRRKIIT